MTAPAQTDDRAEAKERFCNAALWWMADQSCSTALAELEDAHEAYCAVLRECLADALSADREAA